MKEKTQISELLPNIRKNNFEEVNLGYDINLAKKEAARCLNCKNKPCVSGCPVGVPIPEFIECILQDDIPKAYRTITKMNSLPAICGRVCPQEKQCEVKCLRGKMGEAVAIGALERFVADEFAKNNNLNIQKPECNNKKIAIIGSGPAGLACAAELAKNGYLVTIFECLHTAGGVLVYGIPEFRLPKKIVHREIETLKKLGVQIETNMAIGKILSLEELFEKGFKAIFIASGAGLPKFMGIKGENLLGVYSANEFLTRINLMKAYKEDYDTPINVPQNVAVIGAGNVAMDSARSAIRLGAKKVQVIYRRSEQEMPARKEEIEHAKQEGIEFITLTNPIEILGDSEFKVSGLKAIKMQLKDQDDDGRMKAEPVDNSEYIINADCVIMALGNMPNPLIEQSCKKIETNPRGGLIVDENLQTNIKGVFAGGDAVTGAATVILAMGAGKKAAQKIEEFLKDE